jgi:hypothetical protein
MIVRMDRGRAPSGQSYGARDAWCILMAHGRKVARRYGRRAGWYLDGQRVSLAELEDQADRYERIKVRYTPRRPPRPPAW